MFGIFFGPILISHSHDGDLDLSRRILEEGRCEGSGRGRVSNGKEESLIWFQTHLRSTQALALRGLRKH